MTKRKQLGTEDIYLYSIEKIFLEVQYNLDFVNPYFVNFCEPVL